MTFFLDENFPRAAAELLRSRGHQVVDPRGTPEEGASDHALFEHAQQLEAVLLTTDKDFYHTVPLSRSEHCGAIVIALSRPSRQSILAKLIWALEHIALAQLRSRAVLLTDTRCYFRPVRGDR